MDGHGSGWADGDVLGGGGRGHEERVLKRWWCCSGGVVALFSGWWASARVGRTRDFRPFKLSLNF